ncbi:URC4/urg3 family protein [Legionella lytica]|uniref:URC4/urg3 family protein n=1 Tax=Legionella lytica TaxID=96232 RepID=A0ABW8D864_9GAMM
MNKEQQKQDPILTMLRDPHTIRNRAHAILELAKQNKLQHFSLDSEQMAATASFVTEVIQEQYPNLDIPYHSRWRHFEAGGIDRMQKMQEQLSSLSPVERGKVLYELVIISVFLDAGAGPSWRYKEHTTGKEFSRSEGLAIASLDLYQSGGFSAHPQEPFRVDAQRLITLREEELQQGFQVSSNNPLEGVSGRVALLNRLGKAIQENTEYFGQAGRLGDFYTYVSGMATHGQLEAAQMFQAVLGAFNSIWPARLNYQGVALGDVWLHSALKSQDTGSEYVPFHKLSQWLTYSLMEPLEQAGIQVTQLETLTGLPEYRNGGLLIDTGLLRLKDQNALHQAHDPSSELVVEWRALTVALLDELADLIRQNLHKSTQELPLAKILQGGTWEAGRRIAREKRNHGIPPLQIISDGTVF